MGKCLVCGEKAPTISASLGVCSKCIKEKPERALEITDRVHAKSRARFGLPSVPPRDAGGLSCGVCANNCVIGIAKSGFCGLVWNIGGRLVRFGGTAEKGVLECILTVCQPTALVGGFVQDALERAIQNMLTSQKQNMAMLT